jgi:hypothetical protein
MLLLLLLLQGKPFAVFGCGDAVRFKNNYADAVGEVCFVSTTWLISGQLLLVTRLSISQLSSACYASTHPSSCSETPRMSLSLAPEWGSHSSFEWSM